MERAMMRSGGWGVSHAHLSFSRPFLGVHICLPFVSPLFPAALLFKNQPLVKEIDALVLKAAPVPLGGSVLFEAERTFPQPHIISSFHLPSVLDFDFVGS